MEEQFSLLLLLFAGKASNGKYSPKSAIHPDAPVDKTLSEITWLIHCLACGLETSIVPKRILILESKYGSPLEFRIKYPRSAASLLYKQAIISMNREHQMLVFFWREGSL